MQREQTALLSKTNKDSDGQGPGSEVKHHREEAGSHASNREQETGAAAKGVASCCSLGAHAQAILSTAQIYVYDGAGNKHICRALLDSGSQSNVITSALADKLKLKTKAAEHSIFGIDQSRKTSSRAATVKIQSRVRNFSMSLECLILPTVTGKIPPVKIDTAVLKIPANLPLADPQFHTPREVDILIGAGLFWKLLCVGQIFLSSKHPVLQKTLLGWIIGGELMTAEQSRSPMCNLLTSSLDAQLERFFRSEEINEQHLRYTEKEKQCEQQFIETVARDDAGRFLVALPKDTEIQLGESRSTAVRRLQALERRLERQASLKIAYHDFLQEYEAAGHMTEVPSDPQQDREQTYYIPHQAVVKEHSLTTKVRVVFDASAKTSRGTSLNDKLLVGPNLQQDLLEIVLRFRTYEIGFTADIAQMFRQIVVKREDRTLQRILWRWDPDQEIRTYELNTVTYGTSCAPYLAMRCLKQLAIEDGEMHSLARPVLLNDFYMDDVLAGADTVEEAMELQRQLTELLTAGGFQLRKWRCSDSEVLNHIAESNKGDKLMVIDKQETMKTLGLLWNADTDTLQYSVTLTERDRWTKRAVLSEIAKIYDPLGLLGPLLMNAKTIMQQLWRIQLDWDESLPAEVHTKWCTYYHALIHLDRLRIKRHVKDKSHQEGIDLHGFSDASERGYGACIYVVSYDSEGRGISRLLCSKSKLAPLKTITLPRLELNGALLLSRLMAVVWKSLADKIRKTYLWCDSTIVLWWLKTEPRQLKTYVANRVAEVQETTKDVPWRHVPSADNPADVLSRGASVENLLTGKLWWEGPTWVPYPENWPVTEISPKTDIPDIKTDSSTTSAVGIVQESPLQRFSSYTKLKRVFGYVGRFLPGSRKGKETGTLTASELDEAETLIIKMVQQERFPQELEALRKGNQLHKKK